MLNMHSGEVKTKRNVLFVVKYTFREAEEEDCTYRHENDFNRKKNDNRDEHGGGCGGDGVQNCLESSKNWFLVVLIVRSLICGH